MISMSNNKKSKRFVYKHKIIKLANTVRGLKHSRKESKFQLFRIILIVSIIHKLVAELNYKIYHIFVEKNVEIMKIFFQHF